MAHPTRDQLTAAALPGEPTDEAVTAHLADCPACAAEVAALGRTVGLARDGLALSTAPPPPPAVWGGILARLGDDVPDGASDADPVVGRGTDRRNGHRPAHLLGAAPPPARRRRRLMVVAGLAIAAALAVVVVLSPGFGRLLDRSGTGTAPAVTARVALVSTDPGVSGEAVMGPGAVMHVDVVVPTGVPAGSMLEVWAVEPDGMRSLGALAPGPDRSRWTAELTLPGDPADPAQRPALDVSLEPTGTGPQHSGHSVAHSL